MSVRLTQTVQKGGCAAKISAETLRETLSSLDFGPSNPAVLIDGKHFDDAGIYQITPEIALVQTIDFFTPIVDTPFLFGQIAAANALSDVYAMGGVPKTALAVLAFPLATLDPSIMKEVMEGALSKVKEAKCSLLGGHSIDDDTLKFGLSVTGLVHPKRIWSNQSAQIGDHLILTKPLGTGTLCAGLKNGDYNETQIKDALDSMAMLNDTSGLLDQAETQAIHAATDITGFGILGHGMQLAKASNVSLRLQFQAIPLFERTLESLKAENTTKAHRSNRSYTAAGTFISPELSPESVLTLFDPQTSGGLLLCVAPEHSTQIAQKLATRFPQTKIIGSVISPEEKRIFVHE